MIFLDSMQNHDLAGAGPGGALWHVITVENTLRKKMGVTVSDGLCSLTALFAGE